MSYTAIDKPSAGDATRKALADALIDNDGFFNSVISSLSNTATVNGSFEIDSDLDGQPDEWTRTLYAGGTGALDSTESSHGGKSYKFVHPGGGGNGGGYVESGDYFEVSTQRKLLLQWQMKSSVAGIKNLVEVRFFDRTKAFLSSTTAYTSTANPTAWTVTSAAVTVPALARYAKMRFTGGDSSNTTAGSTWFDDILLLQNDSRAPSTITTFSANGNWTCPDHITRIRGRAWGAGAGGGSGNGATTGGAGGAGGYSEASLAVVPGTVYAITVGTGGTGGAAGANNDGTDGGSSTIGSLLTANGGVKGLRAGGGGTGGAGGAATGADYALAGEPGVASGGHGGFAPHGGRGGLTTAEGGRVPGGAGAGSTISGAGGDGANGRVIIEY